jgi:hypothetical protein
VPWLVSFLSIEQLQGPAFHGHGPSRRQSGAEAGQNSFAVHRADRPHAEDRNAQGQAMQHRIIDVPGGDQAFIEQAIDFQLHRIAACKRSAA